MVQHLVDRIVVQGIGHDECLFSAIIIDDDTSNDERKKSRPMTGSGGRVRRGRRPGARADERSGS